MVATPADRSAEALSLAIALESAGLVHFVIQRADDATMSRDHTVVYKGTLEVNDTSLSSQQRSTGVVVGLGVGSAKTGKGYVSIAETVEGLEPNATYEVRTYTFWVGGQVVEPGCQELAVMLYPAGIFFDVIDKNTCVCLWMPSDMCGVLTYRDR